METKRKTIIAHLREKIGRGEPIIGVGAGCGLSAKFAEKGGADLIIIYNSGRYRMDGAGSLLGMLPAGNANKVVLEMAPGVLGAVKETPVLAGVYPNPTLSGSLLDHHLRHLLEIGFAGIQNYPTVGLIDGTFRANLEESGLGYQNEVDCVAKANGMDILTTPYAFSAEEARLMTKAGADIIVAHMGLTTGGSIGADTAMTLDEAIEKVREIAQAAREVRGDVIVLSHGGPISEPADAEKVLQQVQECDGFYGASSYERIPLEKALTKRAAAFAETRKQPEG